MSKSRIANYFHYSYARYKFLYFMEIVYSAASDLGLHCLLITVLGSSD